MDVVYWELFDSNYHLATTYLRFTCLQSSMSKPLFVSGLEEMLFAQLVEYLSVLKFFISLSEGQGSFHSKRQTTR